jgi:hypothetical protein
MERSNKGDARPLLAGERLLDEGEDSVVADEQKSLAPPTSNVRTHAARLLTRPSVRQRTLWTNACRLVAARLWRFKCRTDRAEQAGLVRNRTYSR